MENIRDVKVNTPNYDTCWRCEKPLNLMSFTADVKSNSKKAVNGRMPKEFFRVKCDHCGAETEPTTNIETQRTYIKDLKKYFDDVRYSLSPKENKNDNRR